MYVHQVFIITTRLSFTFVLVRLGLYPHKEVLKRKLLVSVCKSSRTKVSESTEETHSRRSKLTSGDSRGWNLTHLWQVFFLGWPETSDSVKLYSHTRTLDSRVKKEFQEFTGKQTDKTHNTQVPRPDLVETMNVFVVTSLFSRLETNTPIGLVSTSSVLT